MIAPALPDPLAEARDALQRLVEALERLSEHVAEQGDIEAVDDARGYCDEISRCLNEVGPGDRV